MAKAIPASVKRDLKDAVLRGGMEQPQLAGIVQHFVDILGGEREVAKALVDEFRKKDCTPATRARIIDMILGAMRDTSSQFAVDGVGLLSDDDLNAALEAKMKKMATKMLSGGDDAKAAP